jgi:hypothetical protein
VGFNHNVKYGERVYHVQTEDSGLPHAHYITHLFVGGNIIATMKTSYAEMADLAELAKVVRSLMEAQHKRMLKRLIAGEFRDKAALSSAQTYQPGVLADGTKTASYVNTDPALRPAPASPPRAASRPALPPVRPAVRAPPVMVPRAAEVKPLEPAQPSRPAQPRQPGQPLPAVTRGPALPPKKPFAPPRMSPLAPPRAAPRAPPVAAPPKPPVFSDAPVEMPNEDLPTLFAEELISEKSLDEVILAFLSADLDPSHK